jgi:hypothetical protein
MIYLLIIIPICILLYSIHKIFCIEFGHKQWQQGFSAAENIYKERNKKLENLYEDHNHKMKIIYDKYIEYLNKLVHEND